MLDTATIHTTTVPMWKAGATEVSAPTTAPFSPSLAGTAATTCGCATVHSSGTLTKCAHRGSATGGGAGLISGSIATFTAAPTPWRSTLARSKRTPSGAEMYKFVDRPRKKHICRAYTHAAYGAHGLPSRGR